MLEAFYEAESDLDALAYALPLLSPERWAFRMMARGTADFAQSCPVCWRPVLPPGRAPGELHHLTGRRPCECADTRLDLINPLELHGLWSVREHLVRATRSTRPD